MLKRLYNDFFYIPKHGNIAEKVFVTRIIVSVTVIVVCLAAMTFSAYAYFTSTVTSSRNTIAAADYSVEITPPEGMEKAEVYTLDNTQNSEDKVFAFEIKRSAEATASVGYCKIDVMTDTGTVQEYFTKPIGDCMENGVFVTDKARTVYILVKANRSATVEFLPCWGSCNEALVFDDIYSICPEFTEINTNEESLGN